VRIHTQLDPVAHGAFSAAPAGLYDDASIGAAEAAVAVVGADVMELELGSDQLAAAAVVTAGQGGRHRSWLTRTAVEETYYFPTVVSV
jgi:hypothetical protein